MVVVVILVLITAAIVFTGVVSSGLRARTGPPGPSTRAQSRRGASGYRGVCLFDVDGTLSAGRSNYEVVQACLDAGFAVGVSTAGPVWTPNTLSRQPWFPRNLYNFMRRRGFDTFNNTANYVLMGKVDYAPYLVADKRKPEGASIHGWRKGFALAQNARMLGVADPRRMLMFDDSEYFIAGVLAYNPNYNVVCSGRSCGGELDVKAVRAAIAQGVGTAPDATCSDAAFGCRGTQDL